MENSLLQNLFFLCIILFCTVLPWIYVGKNIRVTSRNELNPSISRMCAEFFGG